jgi:hypothetical protein
LKTTKAVIALLLLNLAVVAGLLVFLVRDRPGGGAAMPRGGAEDISGGARKAGPASASAEPEVTVVTVTNQLQWAQLESENYQEYITRLRAIGCPEPTIRDIIIADLDKLMAPQIRALYGRRPELRYWHSVEEELANDVDPREVTRRTEEIEKRKREIVRELVGADLARERMELQGAEDYFERRLGFLPEEKRTQVREVLEKYEDVERRFREKELEDGEPLDAGDRARLRQIAQERTAELGQLLSADEKAQFDLWLSPAAGHVRHALYGMNATEQEFLVAYQARRTYEDKWADRDELFLDANGRAEMERDRAAMETEIRAKFGDERYALFQRGEDEDYHALSALTTRFKLSKEKAAEVYGYKKVAQEIKAQLRSNTAMDSEQRDQALKAVVEETAGAVRAALGERAFRYYLRTGQATWVHE